MTQFQASLIAAGDPEPLPTTVELNQGKLVIASNGQAIGDWPVEDLDIERIVGGFRVKLDGEVAVLKLTHSDEFNAELRQFNESKAEPVKEPRRAKKVKEAKEPRPAARAEAKERPAKDPGEGFLVRLDEKLEVASKKWNRYLPDWLFTRGGVAVVSLFLVAVLAFRSLFATMFLVIAAIGLITSAVALLDQVIAARIFRNGFTPIHGLIGSLAVVLFSILLGATA